MLVATAHGTDLRSIMGNPDLNSLVGGMQVGVGSQEDMGTKMINPCQKLTILSTARSYRINLCHRLSSWATQRREPRMAVPRRGRSAAASPLSGACLLASFLTQVLLSAGLCYVLCARCCAVFGTCTSAFMLAELAGRYSG